MHRLLWLIVLMAGPAMYSSAQIDSTATDSLLVPAKKFPLTGYVIVVDPGHGGDDPGTKRKYNGQTFYEKQFTLGLALKLRPLIAEQGGTVILTVLEPDSVSYVTFGQNLVPSVGADYFNLKSRPKIISGAEGLSKRLEIGNLVLDQYPDKTVHWISIHFDYVVPAKGDEPVAGVRICFSSEMAETTKVQVQKLVKTRPKVNGKRVTRWVWQTRDSIIDIRPTSFVSDLAEAFNEADMLRDPKDKPIVSGSKGGFRHLFILRGKQDPAKVVVKRTKKRTIYNRVYNQILDPVLIEYANFKSDEDWARLQTKEGSLESLAKITVQGLIKHAQREKVETQRDR